MADWAADVVAQLVHSEEMSSLAPADSLVWSLSLPLLNIIGVIIVEFVLLVIHSHHLLCHRRPANLLQARLANDQSSLPPLRLRLSFSREHQPSLTSRPTSILSAGGRSFVRRNSSVNVARKGGSQTNKPWVVAPSWASLANHCVFNLNLSDRIELNCLFLLPAATSAGMIISMAAEKAKQSKPTAIVIQPV